MYILTRHIFTVKQALVCRRLSIQFVGMCLDHIVGRLDYVFGEDIYIRYVLKFIIEIRIRISFIFIYLIVSSSTKTKKPEVETLYLCLAVTIESSLIYQRCMKCIYLHIFFINRSIRSCNLN